MTAISTITSNVSVLPIDKIETKRNINIVNFIKVPNFASEK